MRTFSKDTIFWDRPAQRTSRLSHPTLAYAWGKPCSGTKHWRANCTEKDMVPWFPSNRFAHSREQHWTQIEEMMNWRHLCYQGTLENSDSKVVTPFGRVGKLAPLGSCCDRNSKMNDWIHLTQENRVFLWEKKKKNSIKFSFKGFIQDTYNAFMSHCHSV